ncbi:glycosyltransferase family 2 protein [Naasia sp. SYSU D00948]|uniref:glycosyltransferase family 2 protein n=1 Tax=Naasia sp. SYSU D00948 TaxID=2817379 RepID=UPI0027DB94A6|nr:glycosyltransferase family 2 protein [Naasia sp. SYSU D00948]
MTGSRRWSGEWGLPVERVEPVVQVLIPTFGRPAELAVTLAGLAAQDDPPFDVLVSDQSEGEGSIGAPAVRGIVRVLEAQGRRVELVRHLPRRGLAEHRQFLLDQATADHVLFLDDDIWIEPGTISRMLDALRTLDCGFVGCAPQGLSAIPELRPQDRTSFEPWDGPVRPERIRMGEPGIERASLHFAANLLHIAAEVPVPEGEWVPYKIAWLGACALYRRDRLVECGGFDFWSLLPPEHAGEDVAAQWRVMERYGAAGLLPSGAVHLESPTTVRDRRVEARDVLFGTPAASAGAWSS